MAFKSFASDLYVKSIDTSETNIRIGGFKIVEGMELAYARAIIYISGTLSGTERARLNVYGNDLHTNLLFSSEWSDFSDILDSSGLPISGDWLGLVRFDFDRKNMNEKNWYYFSIEMDNYTRNGDTFYVGIPFDFPVSIYDNSEDLFPDHPLSLQLFGYK